MERNAGTDFWVEPVWLNSGRCNMHMRFHGIVAVCPLSGSASDGCNVCTECSTSSTVDTAVVPLAVWAAALHCALVLSASGRSGAGESNCA
jgi:hypothetical protein